MLRFGFTHNYVESIDKYLFQVLFTAKKVFHPYFWSVTFTLQNPETTPAAIPYCELKNITNVKALNTIYHVWNYIHAELQKRANRANQLVLFFLASANFWEKHAKNRQKQTKTRKNRRFFGANFWGEKLVGANFYPFCNYDP